MNQLETTNRRRGPIAMAVFWVGTIIFIFISASNDTNNYHFIWSRYSTAATIVYGCIFYAYTLYKKGKGIIPYILVGAFYIVSSIIAGVIFEVIDKKNWEIMYTICDKGSFIILCIFFMFADGLLYFTDKVKYYEEGRFLSLVDIPTFIAFFIILLFGSISDIDNMDHFLSGANAFQLIAFNTAFTILLFQLTYFKKEKQGGVI